MAVKAADQITLVDVTDGYSVILSNDSYVFGGTATGQVSSTQSTTTTIQATRGADTPTINVNPNNITITPADIEGVTVTYEVATVGGKPVHTLTITATVATLKGGVINIPVDLDGGSSNGGVTVNKAFSFNIAKSGMSIVDVQNWYLATSASSGVTKDITPTQQWTTTVQQMTAEKQYLWNYEVTLGTGDVELDSTAPVIIGRYGQDGNTGSSIDHIVEWYQISAISATPPAPPSVAGTGYESLPQVTTAETPYLWNYEVFYYTEGNPTVTNARIIGVHGLTGPAGNGIESTITKYAVNTSSTTPPASFPDGSSWHSDVQATTTGQYLWTGMQFVYDDGSISLPVYTVAAHGTPATTHHLQVSADSIIRSQSGDFSPSSITFSSYQHTGEGDPTSYTGDFGIAISEDGSTYGSETILTNRNHVDYTPSSSAKLIKGTLYKLNTGSGNNPVIYDTQTVPVLSDGTDATQYYTYVRYSENADGHDYVATPTTNTKYIGVCITTSTTVPPYNNSAWKWSLYVGADGYNTATKYIYKRLSSAPSSAPADSTYTFSTGTISSMPTGWSESIPASNANADPCYVTSATAISRTDTGTLDWAVPTLFLEDAYNSATLYLYKRSSSQPTSSAAKPSGELTYDFSTGELTPSTSLNGWSMTVPTTSTDPCWMITATVLSNKSTDTIATNEWSTPIRIDGEAGVAGLNQATVYFYKRAASAPSDNPGSITYTFSTGATTTASNNWTRSIPGSNGNPCWVTSGVAIGRNATAIISSWAAATKLVEDGYTITLTNENHTFPGNVLSAVANSQATCGVNVYKGATKLSCNISVTTITGLKYSIADNNTDHAVITFTTGDGSSGNPLLTIGGVVSITISVDGKTFTKQFACSIAFEGGGVDSTEVRYAVSNSGINVPSSFTATTPPETQPGQYLWTRTVTYYTGNIPSTTSYSVAAHGLTGEDTITLIISSSNGWQYGGTPITTTLTAKVFKGTTELNSTQISALGTIKWYQDSTSATPTTGTTKSVNVSANKVVYIAQLENGANLIARSEITLFVTKDILATYVFYDYTVQSNTPDHPTDAQVTYYINNGTFQSGVPWSDAEPNTVDTSYNLFRVEVTRYSDNTFTYSTVTKDSSYEAAKAAKTIADQANTTAGNANTNANNALANSTNAVNKVNQESEIITGTQTTATASWTGTSQYITSLTDGLSINYWLPYNSAANATLKLTLANGTTTDAKNLYYSGTTRLGTQYTAGNLIRLVYRVNIPVAGSGAYTGWWADANYNSDTNYYDRLQYNSAIKAAAAITAGHLICGTATGYLHVAANATFDLSYPLLYAESAIAVNATGTNNYLNYAVTFSTSGTITSGAANKILYLKGTVNGNTFTVASSGYLTTVTPTSADGFYYIPLGTMTSATAGRFVSSNRLFAYIFDAFQAVDVAAYVTDNKIAKVIASTVNGVVPTSLIMRDSTGNWASLTTTGGNGTAKAINTSGFHIDKIYYSIGNSTYKSTSSSVVYTSAVYTAFSGVDLRYSTNCGTTLVAGKPVYLVGTTGTDGLFHLAIAGSSSSSSSGDNSCWTQTPPMGDIANYSSSSTYAVGDYAVYKYIPTFSTSSNYQIGDYVTYNSGYYMCVSPIIIGSEPQNWNPDQWVSVPSITGKDLYRCTTAISSGEAFNAAHWNLITDTLYIYLGIANTTSNITLEENNSIFRWNSETGFTEYSLYLNSTYNSEFNKLNDRIESKVSQSTYSVLKSNVDSISSDLDPDNPDSYKAQVAEQFSQLRQTANSFSISLYGATIPGYGDDATTMPTPTSGSIEGQLAAQQDAISGDDGLQKKLKALSHATGYTKPDPSDPNQDIPGKNVVDYFSFENQGLVIGSSVGGTSSIVLIASNSKIGFYDTSTLTKNAQGEYVVDNAEPLMYIDTKGMHSQENVLSEQINMFNNWALRKGNSGTISGHTVYNLNDVWMGG